MKILLIVFLAFSSSCLFIPFAFALSERCIEIAKKSDLDLNEAECYVLEQIEKGEIAHFKVPDELEDDFEERFSKKNNRTLRANFLKKLLTGSIVELKVTDEGVRISEASVSEVLYILGSKIPFVIELSNFTFEKVVDFSGTQFLFKADFHWTKFSKDAYFDEARFSDEANFNGTQFSYGANFMKAHFTQPVNFREARFSMPANFHWAQFSSEADFRVTHFFSVAFFPYCKFQGNSIFIRCFFHDQAIFDGVTNFSNMQIQWFYNHEMPTKKREEEDIIRRGLKNHLHYNETFYIALIQNYRDMGWFLEADDCYYTYRVEKRIKKLEELSRINKDDKNNPSAIGRWRTKAKLYGEWLLLDLTFGYGVKPKKIFWTFVVFWAFFILLYAVLLRHQWIRKQKWYKDIHKKFFRATIFSLDTLTPGVNFRSESTLPPYTFSHSDFRKPIFNFCTRFQQILGWYWAALFLILFSKIWIR